MIASRFLHTQCLHRFPRVHQRASLQDRVHLGINAVAKQMATQSTSAPQGKLVVEPTTYPKTPRDDSIVEDHFGTSISDPYRALEDPDADHTKAFVDAQNKVTSDVLARCSTREQFKQLFTALYNYPKYGTPFKRGNRYYYFYNSGLQAQHVLYTAPDASGDQGSVFFDPNTLSTDGTVALGSHSFSEDGALWAYTLGSGGSDWRTLHFRHVGGDGESTELEETLEHVKFTSLAWTHDNKGLFYNRFPSPKQGTDLGTETDINLNQQLWYHVVGTEQSHDVKVLELPGNPDWMIGAEVTDDGRYLLLSVTTGCLPANRLWYIDLASLPVNPDTGALVLDNAADKIVKLVDTFDAQYSYIANQGSVFTLKTNLDAPRGKLVTVDVAEGVRDPHTWNVLVPQHDKDLLQWATALKGDVLVLCWLRDVSSKLDIHSLTTGTLTTQVALPGIGSVGEFTGRRVDEAFYFKFTGFTEPGAIYRVDTSDGNVSDPHLVRRVLLSTPAFTPDNFETKQVFYTSKDGTQVPMFIVHRKGLVLDGNNPTLLYGYGGFNISLTPSFSVSRLCWILAYGGVYAVANLRGGGEYGLSWREAGSVHNKQNVFDDFQAAAEYLHEHAYSTPATLAIEGGSNGGLLVAACANQRPDLYACVLGHVGVMDMLRFHKFTIGHAWITDYGNPDTQDDFQVLIRYSPLHNVTPLPNGGQYPAMMLTTGSHDDRVVPLHSHKLIAQLQHVLATANPDASTQRNPLLERVEVRAGHGAGKPTAKIIEEAADCYGFAAAVMGVVYKGPAVDGDGNGRGGSANL